MRESVLVERAGCGAKKIDVGTENRNDDFSRDTEEGEAGSEAAKIADGANLNVANGVR